MHNTGTGENLSTRSATEPKILRSSPPRPWVPMTTMEIYSPDGVSTYTWDDPNRLPRELSGSDVGSFGGMGPAAGPAVGIPTDDAPQPEPEDDGDLELDDGDL